MTSPVALANLALVYLGEKPIVSFDDNTPAANAFKIAYPTAKSFVLRAFPWRCATRSASLALLSGTPSDKFWPFQYAWPNDAIHIKSIGQMGRPQHEGLKWESRGRTILAQQQDIFAVYVADVPEPEMDPHVQTTLAAYLAAELAYTITGSENRVGALNSILERKMAEAQIADRQEASHSMPRIDQLDIVRR